MASLLVTFYGLRSRLYRLGGENFAALENPFRLKCYLCLRNNLLSISPGCTHLEVGADRGTRTPDPQFTKLPLYQLSYVGLRR